MQYIHRRKVYIYRMFLAIDTEQDEHSALGLFYFVPPERGHISNYMTHEPNFVGCISGRKKIRENIRGKSI